MEPLKAPCGADAGGFINLCRCYSCFKRLRDLVRRSHTTQQGYGKVRNKLAFNSGAERACAKFYTCWWVGRSFCYLSWDNMAAVSEGTAKEQCSGVRLRCL